MRFVENFRKRNAGRYPNYSAANAYGAVYAYKQAIEKVKSLDKMKIVQALEGANVQYPEGPRWIRPEDHAFCYTTPAGYYTYDKNFAPVAFLTGFKDIPWQKYYMNPPNYEIP